MPQTLIISNVDVGDSTFDSDRGSWNVTRALADCRAGKHGKVFTFDTKDLLEAASNVDIDEAKVVAMLADKARLTSSPPLIFVEDGGKIWLIDGHHRLHAGEVDARLRALIVNLAALADRAMVAPFAGWLVERWDCIDATTGRA